MAMRPTRPPRKWGPILYREERRALNLVEDAAVHPVQSSQKPLGADKPDLRDNGGKRLAVVSEERVVGIFLNT